MKFVKDWNILYDQQYGFRSKHRTNHAILDIVNTILQNPRSKGPPFPILIFRFPVWPWNENARTKQKQPITGSKTQTKAFSWDFPLKIPVMTTFAVYSGDPRARERRHIPAEKIWWSIHLRNFGNHVT